MAEEKELGTSTLPSYRNSEENETQDEKAEVAEETEKDDNGSSQEVAPADAEQGEDDGEYPTGLAMVFIVLALVLSIFLVSLNLPS